MSPDPDESEEVSRSQQIDIVSRSDWVSLMFTGICIGESSNTGRGGEIGSIVGGVLITSMGTVVTPVEASSLSNASNAKRWNPDLVKVCSISKSGP